jgi:replicative DNA helicase
MLMSPGAIAAVSEELSDDGAEFYRESTAKMYRAALALYGRGEPVDAITLISELDSRGELDDIGGKVRIHELTAMVPTSANARHYARIVVEMATLRGLITAGGEISRLGWDRPGDVENLVDRAEQIVFDLATRRSGSTLEHISGPLSETYQRIVAAYESGSELVGLPSGFRSLDHVTGGFENGNLIVLAARPSLGKSALSLAMAKNVAATDTPVAVFSLEMSKAEVSQRLIAAEARVELVRLRSGRLSHDDWKRVSVAASRINSLPLYVDDSGTTSVMEIRSKARRQKLAGGLGLVVVDYLQLMHSEGKDLYERVTNSSRALKVMARDVDVPVLALAQLSREVERRVDKRPILSDLRDSGAIEQDADLVLFLYRDEVYAADSPKKGVAEVHVAKHRNGPTDTVELAWVAKSASFGELETLKGAA